MKKEFKKHESLTQTDRVKESVEIKAASQILAERGAKVPLSEMLEEVEMDDRVLGLSLDTSLLFALPSSVDDYEKEDTYTELSIAFADEVVNPLGELMANFVERYGVTILREFASASSLDLGHFVAGQELLGTTLQLINESKKER